MGKKFRTLHYGFFGTLKNATYICEKHKYSRRGPGSCPVCREECKSLGDRIRIGHQGQFDKVERKTRNLKGHSIQPSFRQLVARRKRIEELRLKKLKPM